uniref:Uncharacterized protein n=1 Tax=Panagrolaimus davidi TaxID=227884 RepID=A0A914QDJ4_9BILA
MPLNSIDQNLTTEDIPSHDSSLKPDELLFNDRPIILEDDIESESSEEEDEDEEITSNFSDDDINDDENNGNSDNDNDAENDQLDLKEEFDRFITIIRNGEDAFNHNINFWIDLSEESVELYLESFTPTEFSDLIMVFLNEIRQNTDYKYACLVILVKWILNLRRPFYDKFGYSVFGESQTQVFDSPIIAVFENEFENNPRKDLLLAMNMLRMPMI